MLQPGVKYFIIYPLPSASPSSTLDATFWKVWGDPKVPVVTRSKSTRPDSSKITRTNKTIPQPPLGLQIRHSAPLYCFRGLCPSAHIAGVSLHVMSLSSSGYRSNQGGSSVEHKSVSFLISRLLISVMNSCGSSFVKCFSHELVSHLENELTWRDHGQLDQHDCIISWSHK